MNIEVELIMQTFCYFFDDAHDIAKSLRATNSRIVDEDVPGGASAYILQQVFVGSGGLPSSF
ncbi:MAG: hypothetical protein U0T81_10455 [Saprospiraceae bacterium]